MLMLRYELDLILKMIFCLDFHTITLLQKAIRKDSKGQERFEDYFSDSEEEEDEIGRKYITFPRSNIS